MDISPYAQKPFIAIWETTRACALACVHCRAEAMPRRDPDELTTEEGRALLNRVAAFGDPPPLVAFTGVIRCGAPTWPSWWPTAPASGSSSR